MATADVIMCPVLHNRRPDTPLSVGNRFDARATGAELSGGSLHGLRQATMTQLALDRCAGRLHATPPAPDRDAETD